MFRGIGPFGTGRLEPAAENVKPKKVKSMRLPLRDGIATLSLASILVQHIGYPVNGSMPFIMTRAVCPRRR
jgi:hypothetical protein